MPEKIEDFAKRIKGKYKEYADVDDYELVEKMVRKYPSYASEVELPSGFRLLKTSTGYQNLDDIYEKAGRENGVDPNLLLEQGRIETINFKPEVMYGRLNSPAGAKGAGQFMPGTAPTYGLTVNANQDDRNDPIKSITAQAKYMKKLLNDFNGNETLALAGYNAGEYRKELREGRVPNITETQNYVKKIGDALTKARNAPTKALREYYANQAAEIQQQQNGVIPQNYNNTTAVNQTNPIVDQKRNDVLNATTPQERERLANEAIAMQNGQINPTVQPTNPNQAMPLSGNPFNGTVQQPSNPQLDNLLQQRAELYRQRDEATKNNTPQKVLEIRPTLDKVEAEIAKLQNTSADITLPSNPLTAQNQPVNNQQAALSFKDADGTSWEQSADQSKVDNGFVRFVDPQSKKTRVVKLSADGQQIADVFDESNFGTEYETYAQTETANGKTPLSKEQYLDSQYQEYLKLVSKEKQTPLTKDDFTVLVEKPALTQVSGYRTNVQQSSQVPSSKFQVQQQQTSVNQTPQEVATRTGANLGVGGVGQDVAIVSNKGRTTNKVIKTDADFLDTVAGTVDIDTTKKPANMSMDEFILRSSMQAIGGRYGITADQINETVARAKQSGYWASGKSFDDKANWRDPNSATVTISLSTGLFNRALGGDASNLAAPLQNERADQQLQTTVNQNTRQKGIDYEIPLDELTPSEIRERETTRGQARTNLTDNSLLYGLGLVGDPTEEELNAEQSRIERTSLTEDEKRLAAQTGQKLGEVDTPVLPIGVVLANFLGGAANTLEFAKGGLKVADFFGGITNPFNAMGLKLSDNQVTDYFDKSINDIRIVQTEANKNQGFRGQIAATLGSGIFDIPRVVILSTLPGGAVVALAADSGLQSIGRGDRGDKVIGNTAKGAALGAVFLGASRLSQAVEKGALSKLLSPTESAAILKGAENLTGSTRNAYIASKLLGEGTRIGTVGAGTFAVEKVSGATNEEAFHAAIGNILLDVALAAKTPIQNLAGRVFRVRKGAEVADVYVDGDGALVKLKNPVPDGYTDGEIVLDYNPQTKQYEWKGENRTKPSEQTNYETVGGQKVENRPQESQALVKKELETSQTPRELQERNPLRAETANPQAIEKVKLDTRAQKISDVLADGSAKSVDELQKLTRYNQKNISETIDTLFQARVVEILPDNTVRLISDVPKAENLNLYEKYSNQPIKLNESSEVQQSPSSMVQSEIVLPKLSESKVQPSAEVKSEAITKTDTNPYENLPQQKLQEVAAEKPVAKIDFAERENIGEKLNVFTERGTKAQIQPKVVESSDLLTSLDANYPQEFQPRDRSRAASKAQVADIANKLNPEFLGDSPKASDGRPLVVPVEMPDGSTKYAVISGNGRTAAIRQAYNLENEGSQKYAEFVRSKGDTGAKQPVYVGILNPNEIADLAEFAKEANESTVAQMSATEQAKSDAERIDLSGFTPSEDGSIHGTANRNFIRLFMASAVSPSEKGKLMMPDGTLSQEGVQRIRNAIFAKAFGNSEAGLNAVQRMSESTDNNVKNITNGLLSRAGAIASFKEAAKQGTRPKELDISSDLAKAMEKFSALKDSGTSVDEYIAQGNLFGA